MPKSAANPTATTHHHNFSRYGPSNGYEGRVLHETHIRSLIFPIPEGFAICARCTECGGRAEALTDLRSRTKADGEEAELPAMMLGDPTFQRVMSRFSDVHAGCAEHPIQYTLPDPVRPLLEKRLQDVEDLLTAGKHVVPTITVLRTDGVELATAIPRIPTRGVGRTGKRAARLLSSQMAEIHFRMRENARASSSEVLAAVVVGEQDYIVPRIGNARDVHARGIGVTVVTPGFARVGLAPMIRVVSAGPIDCFLGKLTMRPLTELFMAIEGLYALTLE